MKKLGVADYGRSLVIEVSLPRPYEAHLDGGVLKLTLFEKLLWNAELTKRAIGWRIITGVPDVGNPFLNGTYR